MFQNKSNNYKLIAKNTIMLYFRMIVLMVISLFTSRVILQTLGEIDFGVYNVVGGVVVMFSVLSSSLSGSISRFITYELGVGDKDKIHRIFATSVSVQIGMALLIGLFVEVLGVWFLNTHMNIPEDRMIAANWVLHCTTLSFMIGLISVPYNATIIAHEKMSAFAFISLFEAVLKLIIVYLLYISPFDKLISFVVLLLIVSVIIRVIYGLYCNRQFEEAYYDYIIDKSLIKEITTFAGWQLFGNTAYVLNTQGINMLINIFFGVSYNASRGIAVQVDSAVTQFVNSFTTALNPQIVKSYASDNKDYLFQLITKGTKYSYYIMFLLVVPFVLETDIILGLWLVKIPKETVIFSRLVLFTSLTTVMGNSMLTAINATGVIKRYQIIVTFIGSLVFPISWIAYEYGAPAYITYIIYFVLYFLLNFVRVSTLNRLIGYPIKTFIIDVLCRLVLVSFLSFTIPYLIIYFFPISIGRLILTIICSLLWTILCIVYVGMSSVERKLILSTMIPFVKIKFNS